MLEVPRDRPKMRGIVLAGGSATRLQPLTGVLSKQQLPVYDKPMIYYPLSVLMLGGIRDILIISSHQHVETFQMMLGDGSRIGININYAVQDKPRGVADAFRVGEKHIGNDRVALILGDNVFHGPGFSTVLHHSIQRLDGCELFGYPTTCPERYGIAEIDAHGGLLSLEEKPQYPSSNLAVTGLYLYDTDVTELARELKPSTRGELEITDINLAYLKQGRARLTELGRGFAWLDMGTHDSLLQAGQYVQLLEQRQGVRIACIEEIALRMGFIDADTCHRLGEELTASSYGSYLMKTASQFAATG